VLQVTKLAEYTDYKYPVYMSKKELEPIFFYQFKLFKKLSKNTD